MIVGLLLYILTISSLDEFFDLHVSFSDSLRDVLVQLLLVLSCLNQLWRLILVQRSTLRHPICALWNSITL
jgi:hypothetical protein